MIAWFNGELLPLNGIAIPATDRGFLLGDGFYETIACNNGHPVRFLEHLARLQKSADFMNFALPYDLDEIQAAIHDVLVGCQLMKTRAALRLTITRGSGPRGLLVPTDIKPLILISAAAAPTSYTDAKVKTVSIVRNEHNPSAKIKSLCYIDNIFAFEEAHKAGCDEALLLNTKGNIAEGSISNIFFIKGNILLTPALNDGALCGIMRDAVLKKASLLGLQIEETSLRPEITSTCDEAFLTNSLCRVRPISEIDGRKIPAKNWGEKLLSALIRDEG
jgi:branched-chain amino acid aminotransferase